MSYYTQINEAKRTFESAKIIYDRLRKRADTLEAQMSRTGNKMPYPGHQKDMGPVKGALDSFIKYHKESDKPSTADIPNSYTKSLERAEKALDKIEKKQKDYEAKQGALKSKYEAGKAKEAKEKRGLSGTYVSDSFDFKQRTRQYLGLNEMAFRMIVDPKDFGPDLKKKFSREDLIKIFNENSVKTLANNYITNARTPKTKGGDIMSDTKIAQGLGSSFRGVEPKDKVDELKSAIKGKLNLGGTGKKKKEEKKVEESTRYRRNFR